jgi:transposase-like protein
MSDQRRRRFSRDFKLRVIERLESGESGTALGLELSIKRTIIYRWRDQWRHGGTAALPGTPGPRTQAEALELERARGVQARANDLTETRRQIAELQKKVGQQQVDLDFFKQALRRIEASRQPSIGSGATASSPRSKR